VTAYFPFLALVKRELITTLRRTRSFLFLVAIVAAVGLFAAITLGQVENLFATTNYFFVSFYMLETVFGVMRIAGLLLLPGLAAAAIASEREGDSLDLLRMCLVKPGGIILAKLANTVGFYLLLMIAVLPVVGVVFFLVGVDQKQMIVRSLEVLSIAVGATAIGLMFSAWLGRTTVALVVSYCTISTLALLIYVTEALTRTYSSAYFIADQLAPAYRRIGFALVFAILGLLLASVGIRRPPRTAKLPQGRVIEADDTATLLARRQRFPYYLIDPLKRKPPIGDGRNAIFTRELRYGFSNRAAERVRMFYVSFAVFFVFGVPFFYGPEKATGTIGGLILFHGIFIAFVAPAFLATTFTKERASGNADMLRLTLLSSWDIVLGKFLSGFATVLPMAAASLLVCLPGALIAFPSGHTIANLAVGYLWLTVVMGISLSLSLFASARANSPTAAAILAYVLILLLLIGGFILPMFTDPSSSWGDWVYMHLSPFSALSGVVARAGDDLTRTLVNGQLLINIATFGMLAVVFLFVTKAVYEWQGRRA